MREQSWRISHLRIETQTLTCQEYALKENIQVVEVYTDYEYSGTNLIVRIPKHDASNKGAKN